MRRYGDWESDERDSSYCWVRASRTYNSTIIGKTRLECRGEDHAARVSKSILQIKSCRHSATEHSRWVGSPSDLSFKPWLLCHLLVCLYHFEERINHTRFQKNLFCSFKKYPTDFLAYTFTPKVCYRCELCVFLPLLEVKTLIGRENCFETNTTMCGMGFQFQGL